jgi:hypothetical protein
VVKAELERAWREAFASDLGEPTLSCLAQAIQDRQPWPIGWRSADRAAGAAESSLSCLRTSMDLRPSERAPRSAHNLIREALGIWGLGAAQVVEDAQLLTESLLSGILSRVPPSGRLRIEVTYRDPDLRVDLTADGMTAEHLAVPTMLARRHHRSTLVLLNDLARTWGRQTHPGGERIWFELLAGAPA